MKAPVLEVQPSDYDLVTITSGPYGSFDVVRFPWGSFGERSPKVRNNKTHPCEVDDTEPVKVCRFIANRDFECTNGTKIAKGHPQWMVIQ